MRKSSLEKCIVDHLDKRVAVNHPLYLLNKFSKTPVIQNLNKQDSITFEMFESYLNLQGRKKRKLFNPKYFASNDASAPFFLEFISEEATTVESSKKTTRKKEKKFSIGSLYDDAQQTVFSFLDEKTLSMLSATNSLFHTKTKQLKHWRSKLVASGCQKNVLLQVAVTGAIRNYKNLYHAFMKVWYGYRIQMKESWELMCLSGDVSAIQYAVQHEQLTKDTKNKFGDNALLLAALSGSAAQMRFAYETVGIDAHSENDAGVNALLNAAFSGNIEAIDFAYRALKLDPANKAKDKANVYHYAALSGNISALKHVIKIFKNIKLTDTSELGETLLHFAARSGSVPMMQFVMDDLGFDPRELDCSGENFLYYAIRSGDTAAFKYALKKLKKADPTFNPMTFVSKEKENILHTAFISKNLNMIRCVASELKKSSHDKPSEFQALANSINEKGMNALHIATNDGDVAAMHYAVEELKINPGVLTREKSNILHLAAISGNPAAVTYAVELNKLYKLDLSLEQTNRFGRNAFYFADKSLSPEVMKNSLIDSFKSDNERTFSMY